MTALLGLLVSAALLRLQPVAALRSAAEDYAADEEHGHAQVDAPAGRALQEPGVLKAPPARDDPCAAGGCALELVQRRAAVRGGGGAAGAAGRAAERQGWLPRWPVEAPASWAAFRPARALKFIHVTKTGGTSIEDWGRDHGQLWGRFEHEYRAPGMPGSPWHHPFPALPVWLRHKYDWFMVVRDPVDRVVSEYYCKYTGSKTIHIDSEADFNYWIQGGLNGTRPLEPGSFLRTSDYLDPSSKQNLVRYETLEADLARILLAYGINFDHLPKHNKHRGNKYHRGNLWPATLRLIRDWFASDFSHWQFPAPVV